MAASAATHTYGTTIGYADTSGGSYTTVGEVIDIDYGGMTCSATKRTHLSSDSSTHEYTPGLLEPGEISMTINYVESQFNTLFTTLASARLQKFWKITFAGSSTFVCAGHITKIGAKNPEDDRITTDITIKLSGLPVYTVV